MIGIGFLLAAVCLLPFVCLSAQTEARDPTVPTAAMADLLKRNLPSSPRLALQALVVGAADDGVALLGTTPREARVVRKGSVVSETVEGIRVSATIASVTVRGVTLGSGEPVLLSGGFTPLAAPSNMPPEFVRHLESVKVPLDRLVRLIADQTGVNISSSDAAAEKTVTIFLRNVTAEAAVEEICRATGLWFRRDPEGGVIRITTMEEYAENLSSFREETTKTFTLLYPNVVEIASVIYGLYPDRTLLSLGEQEVLEDDEHDLSRRFRRFRMVEQNGNSQFMNMQAPQASSTGSGSGGGDFSFSRGNAFSRLTQWDALRQRGRFGAHGAYSTPEAMLSSAAAKRLNEAVRTGNTNDYERVYQRSANAAANIFVSMSRRNNLLIVRTSDVKVMDEITRLVRELDVPTPMVLLEMRVLELQLEDDFSAKFEWKFNGAGGITSDDLDLGKISTENAVEYLGTAGAGAMNAFQPTFAFAAVSKHVLSQIRLLAQDGKVRTLATPTLLVANNEVSRIFNGSEYPLVSGWTAGEQTESALVGRTWVDPIVEIEKKDVGDMLLISPNINADKTITLRLLHENSYVVKDGATIPVTGGTGQDKKIDYVDSRSVTGTFVAKDGMTVMAGGLISEKESDQYYRTPILGSIPFLGFLFRGTERVKERTEMIILIKPHVIMTPMEGGKISSELMKQLSDHPAADGRPNMGVFREGEDPTAKDHTLGDDFRNFLDIKKR